MFIVENKAMDIEWTKFKQFKIVVRDEPYWLWAEWDDLVNREVRVVDRQQVWRGMPIWKIWYGCVLKKTQWKVYKGTRR